MEETQGLGQRGLPVQMSWGRIDQWLPQSPSCCLVLEAGRRGGGGGSCIFVSCGSISFSVCIYISIGFHKSLRVHVCVCMCLCLCGFICLCVCPCPCVPVLIGSFPCRLSLGAGHCLFLVLWCQPPSLAVSSWGGEGAGPDRSCDQVLSPHLATRRKSSGDPTSPFNLGLPGGGASMPVNVSQP